MEYQCVYSLLRTDQGTVKQEAQFSLGVGWFTSAASIIDGYIEKAGKLNGIIIQVESFSGWDSFSGFTAHMKFVKEHHKEVSYVALVTDSLLAEFAEHIVNHFVSAEVKHFSFDALDDATKWIEQSTQQ